MYKDYPAPIVRRVGDAERTDVATFGMVPRKHTELLTFLVIGQLFAFAHTGEWLRTDHLIKSAQMWLSSNGAACDWLEHAQLVEVCRAVAIKALDLPFPAVEADMVLFFNLNRGWFLDYRKLVVQQIHAMCVAHLSHAASMI
ncbi:hypothetical protein [Paraburkholderia oxyphila]|uniref:hypothetical protein n=1 Tax=Paraburkholderia oxyphila TaxID=614212 RepID=UPI000694FC7E|nr:hypothetical protein [Paraburkholderia oxyphila]